MASNKKSIPKHQAVAQWPQKIIPLADLKPYERNPRKFTPEAYERLKSKISRFGYHGRIIATQDLKIIGGHLRLRVLRELGIDPVAVLIAPRALTDEEYRELLITDNLQDGEWDTDILEADFEAAQLEMWGVPAEWFTSAGGAVDGLTDDDDTPDAPAVPVSAPGDVWTLGAHRVMCGDSTNAKDVRQLLRGTRPEMVFTDPPYGVNIVNTGTKKIGGGGALKFKKTGKVGGDKIVNAKKYAPIIGDETTDTAKRFYDTCLAAGLKNFIIFGGNYFTDFLPPSPCWIVWDKQNTGHFADVELAWTSKTGGAKLYAHLWNGLARKGDHKTELATRVHPTQKPVGLFEEIFEDFPFSSCFDGFLGSGSTLIACEKTGRICYGMEMSQAYCDVIIDRWQKFTGHEATHAETGETFNSRIPVSEARPAGAARVEARA